MHGVVLWNKSTKAHTQLVTWQGSSYNHIISFIKGAKG